MSDGGFKNWNWGQFGKSVGLGALSGAVTAGIGNMGIGNVFAKAYLHGFAQGSISTLGGGDFLQGFASGALGSFGAWGFGKLLPNFAGSAVGTIGFGALAGGIGAELTGGEFWKGAVTGGMVAGLNDVLHNVLDGGDPGKGTEGKGNKFRGGKQKVRDGDLGKTSKKDQEDFNKWYHEKGNSKHYKLKGQPDPDIMEPYNDWIDLGKPRFSPVGIGVGAGLGASIIYYGSRAIQLIGNRLTMPLLIIPQLLPQQNNQYGINQQPL